MKFVPHNQADIAKVLEGKQGVVSPVLRVSWAGLGIPATTFKDKAGQVKPLKGPTKSVALLIDPEAPEQQAWLDFCREVYDQGIEKVVSEEKLDLEDSPAKPYFIKKDKDKEGMATGLYRWSTKKQVGGVRKKDGSEWTRPLSIADSGGKAVPEAVADTIGRDSLVRVFVKMRPYEFGGQPGVTTDLDGVMLMELVERSGGGPSFADFADGGGFTIEGQEVEAFSENIAGEHPQGSSEGDY